MKKTKGIFMVSATVFMFSVTAVIGSCMYTMNQAQAKDVVVEAQTNMAQMDTVSGQEIEAVPSCEPATDSTEAEDCTAYHKDVEVKGTQYTYYMFECEKEENTKPKDNNISPEEAIKAADNALVSLFGFKISEKTYIDVNFNGSMNGENEDSYWVVTNNCYSEERKETPEERFFVCQVDGITGQILMVKDQGDSEVNTNEHVFELDEDGNGVGWEYPTYFANATELAQLKSESKEIAENFLKQSGIVNLDDIEYVKTEAYKDMYPWTLDVFFEKGDEIIEVSIYAENKTPYGYKIIKG